MGPGVALADCDLDEASNATELIRPICDRMSDDPDSAEVASASSILAGAMAVTTESSAPSETPTNIAG
ncbi:hypothetical protein NM208_g7880 [Fusarium decemcellulare]|uniref:Uncharacterized protein n=1 Tax=Fusarium decemcellulare TaxID=57161 RepID=A0ACC1S7E1_9HYPO|nr:hypothetical protein NM208_g7880 [Fusarium decemcellulare]